MDKPSILTRREQADRGALHLLSCTAGQDPDECTSAEECHHDPCRECEEGAQALAAAWPVKVYQLVDNDGDNDYLVRAFDEDAAWAWLAKDWGMAVDKIKKSYTIREANINEAP